MFNVFQLCGAVEQEIKVSGFVEVVAAYEKSLKRNMKIIKSEIDAIK